MNNYKLRFYIHHVPGRLRVRVPAAKRNQSLAEQIYQQLRRLDGVTSAEISLTTGSVLVHYDIKRMSERPILDVLEPWESNWTASPRVPQDSGISLGITKALTKAVAGYVLDQAIGYAAVRVLAAVL